MIKVKKLSIPISLIDHNDNAEMFPLTHINKNNTNIIFTVNHITPGIIFKGYISKRGNHPPKNNITVMALIKIILAYSAKKKSTNDADEYSVKKPATKVDSSSGKSKGNLFVSAKAEIKKNYKHRQ